MNNSMKVALWEVKKNLTNKSFLISIILTPLIMIIFGGLPTLLSMLEYNQTHNLYIRDEIGIYQELHQYFDEQEVDLINYSGTLEELKAQGNHNRTSFVHLDDEIMEVNSISIHALDDSRPPTASIRNALNNIIRNRKMEGLGLTAEQIQQVDTNFDISIITVKGEEEDFLRKMIPAIFAAMIYFSIFFSGAMTFQSSTQEKKDKMVEILLSSVTPGHLMQGKIVGCFILGMIQVVVWLAVGIPIAYLVLNIPIIQLIAIKELPLMIFYALAGYLLFSSIFVSLGATIEDPQSQGNFQGMIFLLPMLPFFFFGPIIANPHGIVAKIGTYFPFSTPGVMLLRLSLANRVPTFDIILSIIIIVITTYFVMKLAGKLFKTAILMYGKNATPQEIFKWIRY
ncbi:ABC transporter permease [Alkaliphilus peptidifermentans]|uniref:ABC-2 type transport system permease protein n=1 Tax=Alkaliphilus peptidifermentans DSM 18978 TaxID=1120976 RepID=A0A1G5F5I4_9FIRM|nr:ABC transporter permease [Alkaliphilus peptidifermentans]SCY33888.1 ABC-2 type transport system permease protein [Alkaliphilus peptidifermentans DSM 18978]